MKRRRFLRGSLAGMASAPFLRSFGASAQDGPKPKLVVYASGSGAMVGPTGGADYEGWLPSSMHAGEGLMEMPTTGTLPETLRPFERVADQLLAIDGLRGTFGCSGHKQTPVMLSGGRRYNNVGPRPGDSGDMRSDTQSVDQLIAEALGSRVLGMSYKINGYQGGEGYISHTAPGEPFTPYQNAHDAFDAVFAAGGGDDDGGAARRRGSVLDAMTRDARILRARLPSSDRPRLDQHLESIRGLERDLGEAARPTCSAGTRPPEFDSRSSREVPRLMRSYASTMTQALACGYTQVGFLQTGNLEGTLLPHWDEFFAEQSNVAEHQVAHKFAGVRASQDAAEALSRVDAVRIMMEFQHFHNTMVAELVESLANTMDVDGQPMLRNTIVLQIRPMGRNHNSYHLLWNMFGGQNLGIRTGRFLRLDSSGDQQPYVNDLLVSIAQAMGVPLEQIGHPPQNRGPLNLG